MVLLDGAGWAEKGWRLGTNAAAIDWPLMTEPSPHEFNQEDLRGPLPTRRGPWVFALLTLLSATAAGSTAFWFINSDKLPPPPPPRQDAAAQIAPLERQLESFEADLAAQKSEIRRLSDEVAALNNKLYAMQQSFDSAPVAPVAKRSVPAKKGPPSLTPPNAATAARP
jgi:uncharacterized coiled-coil protein SlyX